jgi:hypothetical protein
MLPEDEAARAAARRGAQPAAEPARWKATGPRITKKRLILPMALIVAIVAIVISLAVNGSPHTTTVTSPAQADVASLPKADVTGLPKADSAVAAGIGTKVRDGSFEFVVTRVERPGKSLVGKVGETLTAQGEFVIIRVDVTNVGTEEQRLDCACQFLSNDKGQKFAPSSSILRTKEALKYVAWIQPGEKVKNASVLFDVAPGTEAVSIELHDTPSSKGVNVKLS